MDLRAYFFNSWDQGILGLCVGAKAILTIPPKLGYGERGAGGAIPGGATLKFDVEVVKISEDTGSPEARYSGENLFAEIDTDENGHLTSEEILAYFKTQGMEEIPEGLMEHEDKDNDGKISWEEFSGPKGGPRDEL